MKYTPQAIFGVLSGKAGSNVASRNGVGHHIRSNRQTNKYRTSKRSAVRVIMTIMSRLWNSLTMAQHTAWDVYGLTLTKTNTLGQTYHLSGNAAFKAVNGILLNRGINPIPDPPSSFAPDNFSSFTLTVTPGAFGVATMVLDVSPDIPSGAFYIDIFAWPPQPMGRANPPRRREQLLYSFPITPGVTSYDLATPFFHLWGSIPANRLFFLTVATITVDGVRCEPVIAQTFPP